MSASLLLVAALGGAAVSPPYGLEVRTLAGKAQTLEQHRGKVLLVVNTASECGQTPQYEGLQTLHARYAARGLVVLGFPSNDFGGQEPGTNAAIARFCKTTFGVAFPMFAKTPVTGPRAHPLYRWLAAQPASGGPPTWNFTKYLVGRDGAVRARFDPHVEPSDAQLVSAIETALGPTDAGAL